MRRGSRQPLLVVVTGPPGAGKSTLARALADELSLPLVAKDGFKETLFRTLPATTVEESRVLGVASWDILFHVVAELLRAGVSTLAEGNFSRPGPFRALPPAHVVQVHVTAPADLLLARYRLRERHPGHQTAAYEAELRERLRAGDWGPLDLPGTLLSVNTAEIPPAAADLARRIRAA